MENLLNSLLIKRCPHCSVDTPNLQSVWETETRNFQNTGARFWRIYKCSHCGGLVTACAKRDTGYIDAMFPNASRTQSKALPERVQEYLNQAEDSLNAPSGSVMLSASAVDAMLKEKSYKEGSLYSRINKAVEDHQITKDMGIWAHEIRLDANEQRHADEEFELPSEADAKRCFQFARTLATFLFILPSMVTRGIEDAKENT